MVQRFLSLDFIFFLYVFVSKRRGRTFSQNNKINFQVQKTYRRPNQIRNWIHQVTREKIGLFFSVSLLLRTSKLGKFSKNWAVIGQILDKNQNLEYKLDIKGKIWKIIRLKLNIKLGINWWDNSLLEEFNTKLVKL